jgi:hypothetical protein
MKKIIYSFLLLGVPALAKATQNDGTKGAFRPGEGLPNPLKFKTVEDLLDGIADFLLTISIPVATIMIIYGAFQILTAAGDPEKFKTGKQTILYAVIGLAIILLFKVIMALIKNLLGVQEVAPLPGDGSQFRYDRPIPIGPEAF